MNEPKVNSLLKDLWMAIEKGKSDIERANSNDPFKIVVCGAFSTGKTSLLNALLGCELPTGIRPITKVVTSIRYGAKREICLENMVTGQKRKLSRQEADEWIVNKSKNAGYHDYRVEYDVPSPFLKQGVEFLDTPGFQDAEEEKLDEMTKKAIREADFCIVTFACNSFGDMHEKQFLEELQTLTNGNFVCVLNCANRIKSMEEQEELQQHAKIVLDGYGNEQVGYSRYFMVDSDKDSEEKYLDGLDQWLINLVKYKAADIRREAAVSRGQSEIIPLIEKGTELFKDIQNEYENYMLQRDKQQIAECHKQSLSSAAVPAQLLRIKKNFFQSLDNSFCAILKGRLEKVSRVVYNHEANSVISNAILDYSNDLERAMRRGFSGYDIPDPWEEIKKTTFTWTKLTTWTTQKGFGEYMSDGLSLGIWDWNVQHENEFVKETIKDTESKTIPEIKKHANAYFSKVEKRLVSQQCMKVLSANSAEQENYVCHLEKIAEVLMEAMLLNTQFRKLVQE